MADYGKLVRIAKHPNFWKDSQSEIIYWRGTIQGEAYKKSTGTTKIMEAKRFIEDFKIAVTSSNVEGEKRKKRGVRNPCLADLWADMIKENEVTKSAGTMRGYNTSWKKMSPYWGDKHVKDISETSVARFQNWYIETYPGDGFFNTRKHLGMLFSYLLREKLIQSKPKITDLDKEVINAKYKKKKPFRVFTEKEQSLLIKSSCNELARVALTVLFDTGMRKMELMSREWTDVDFKNKVFNIWSQKNKAWRPVPMTKRVHRVLKDWHESSSKGRFVFPMKTDVERHISGQLFDKVWVETKQIAMLKGRARVHDIRHTFATRTAQDGWPIPIACKVLDMSAGQYMKTYTHINEKDISTWLDRSFS